MPGTYNWKGFPGGPSGKEPAYQCRRHKGPGFNPWVGKISWRRAWQPTPVFLPGVSHGQRSQVGYNPESRKAGHDWRTTAGMHTYNCSCLLYINDYVYSFSLKSNNEVLIIYPILITNLSLWWSFLGGWGHSLVPCWWIWICLPHHPFFELKYFISYLQVSKHWIILILDLFRAGLHLKS